MRSSRMRSTSASTSRDFPIPASPASSTPGLRPLAPAPSLVEQQAISCVAADEGLTPTSRAAGNGLRPRFRADAPHAGPAWRSLELMLAQELCIVEELAEKAARGRRSRRQWARPTLGGGRRDWAFRRRSILLRAAPLPIISPTTTTPVAMPTRVCRDAVGRSIAAPFRRSQAPARTERSARVFMRLGITEIGKDAIAHELGDDSRRSARSAPAHASW